MTGIGEGAETRFDAISREWTIFAPSRQQRPYQFQTSSAVQDAIKCPFCIGHESETPDPTWAARIKEDHVEVLDAQQLRINPIDDWAVRVVPNKYPAVSAANSSRLAQPSNDLFRRCPATGGHEVVIESPEHFESIHQLDPTQVALIFRAYQDRIRFWREQPDISYISVFKNVGGQAGASLHHSHSQIIAMNQIPQSVRNTVDFMRQHQATTGCCLQCDLVRAERKAKSRIVAETESFVVYCPFASRLPMLIRITSKQHQPRFESLDDKSIEDVSRLLWRTTGWLNKICPGASYNLLLHTQPPLDRSLRDDSFHWSIEIFPRLTHIAGFEWSSNCMINPVLPEIAASQYRSIVAGEDPRNVL